MLDEKSKFDAEFTLANTRVSETVQMSNENAAFQRFIAEYSKMHRALLRSKEHISKLVHQFQDLDVDYGAHVAQTQEASKSLENDSETIHSLKDQIRQAEKRVDQSIKTEDDSKNELRQLKVDILNLTNTTKQGVGLSATQEKALSDLIQTKEMYAKDLDSELEKIIKHRNEISEVSERIRSSDLQKRELERDIFNLKEKNAAKKAEIDTETRNKDRMEKDLRELRVVVTVKSQEVRTKQDAVNRATDDISILDSQIKTQKQLYEKLNKDEGEWKFPGKFKKGYWWLILDPRRKPNRVHHNSSPKDQGRVWRANERDLHLSGL